MNSESRSEPSPGLVDLVLAACEWKSFRDLRARIRRARPWKAAAETRGYTIRDVSERTGISPSRCVAILNADGSAPNSEEERRLDAVLLEGRAVDTTPPTRASRTNFGRRGAPKGGEWDERLAVSKKNLVDVSRETGIPYFRVRRLFARDAARGCEATDEERSALSKVLGTAE